MRRVAAVILAAGASRRLGEAKQLVKVGGERLLERAVRVALAAGCSPVVVVLGASAERIMAECGLAGVQVEVNERWEEGMGASVRFGIAAAARQGVDGAVVMTCDQPAVTVGHLRELMNGGEMMASSYGDRRGVPAYFPAGCFADLLALRGDNGARTLLASAAALELPGGELDVDSPEALEAARAIYGGPLPG